METLIGSKHHVLDKGHVVLLAVTGSDEDIVNTARTSYQGGTRQTSDNQQLLRYLFRHEHSTPFESAWLKLHVRLPIFVERQWARHRVAGWNEVSARYSELPADYYIPNPERVQAQSTTNKQGSEGTLNEAITTEFRESLCGICDEAYKQYEHALSLGVSRELARVILPVNWYTEKVWWCNLRGLLHFLGLRMNEHAQKEIRDFADVIGHEIVSKLFPITWKAFLDYRLEAMQLTRLDIRAITNIQRGADRDMTLEVVFNNKRERQECLDKLNLLGIGQTHEAST